MTKAEFLKYLEVGPDDAEVVIADYVGDDLEIGDVIYFAKEKLFWIRTADLVWEEDSDEVETETSELSPRVVGPGLGQPCMVYIGGEEKPPVDVVKARGKQRAA